MQSPYSIWLMIAAAVPCRQPTICVFRLRWNDFMTMSEEFTLAWGELCRVNENPNQPEQRLHLIKYRKCTNSISCCCRCRCFSGCIFSLCTRCALWCKCCWCRECNLGVGRKYYATTSKGFWEQIYLWLMQSLIEQCFIILECAQ